MASLETAISHYNSGRFAEALAAVEQALTGAPNDGAALNIAGACARALGQANAAESYWRRAIAANPRAAEALSNLGVLLHDMRRLDEAEAAHRAAIAIKSASAPSHFNLARVLAELGRADESEASYRRALQIDPRFVDAWTNLGTLLLEGGRVADAEMPLRRATQLAPAVADVQYNYGSALKALGKFEAAADAYRRALGLSPRHAGALQNLGTVYKHLGKFGEAEKAYRDLLRIDPDDANARWNMSLLLLTTGRYAEGWPLFDARYDAKFSERTLVPPTLPFPQWRGEDLAGKSILVLREQGIGDEIQCARFIPMLRAHGARIITMHSRASLETLFARNLGADRIVTADAAFDIPPHDYWAYLFTLPRYLWPDPLTTPATVPYLRADPARVAHWRQRIGADGLKIGLSWKGSALHRNDRNRSLPGPLSLRPLWSVPGVRFYSLQKGQDEGIPPPADQPMIDLAPALTEFAETAAAVMALDLVISVDTAVVHLSGALGRPAWVLLPAIDTDWRWLQGRSDSPWYPGALTLFRQKSGSPWSDVIADVATALKKRAGG